MQLARTRQLFLLDFHDVHAGQSQAPRQFWCGALRLFCTSALVRQGLDSMSANVRSHAAYVEAYGVKRLGRLENQRNIHEVWIFIDSKLISKGLLRLEIAVMVTVRLKEFFLG